MCQSQERLLQEGNKEGLQGRTTGRNLDYYPLKELVVKGIQLGYSGSTLTYGQDLEKTFAPMFKNIVRKCLKLHENFQTNLFSTAELI